MKDALLTQLGKNLRLERTDRGMSQERFAEVLDVHRTRVGDLERGKANVTLRTLQTLGDRLEMNPLDLLQP